MQIPRMTIRGWMLAIVLVSLIAGPGVRAIKLMQVARGYRDTAINYEGLARLLQKNALAVEESGYRRARTDEARQQTKIAVERHAKVAEYYLRLRAKYDLAANRPWLPVEPDPLPP